MAIHKPQVLADLTGTLMTVDIDDVQVGDVMFMGGHLVRRVMTRPSERTYRQDHDWSYRVWLGLPVNVADPRGVVRGEFTTAVGQACLILRPTTDLTIVRVEAGTNAVQH